MKKFLVITGSIILFLVIILFDYLYYPLVSYKASNFTEDYLEEKYNEDFEVGEAEYSKQLEHDIGAYDLSAHPVNNPEISISIHLPLTLKDPVDNYPEMKWRWELNKEIYRFIGQHTDDYSLKVNVTFPTEIQQKYTLDDTYLKILRENPDQISNYLFLHIFRDPKNEIDKELQWIYELLHYLNKQQLKDFTITTYYYNEELVKTLSEQDKKLNFDEFEDNYDYSNRSFTFRFGSQSTEGKKILEDLKSPEQLKVFIQEVIN